MPNPRAPHKEQDGWAYIRVPKGWPKGRYNRSSREAYAGCGIGCVGPVFYDDTLPGSRVISSRRVERAVETDDFLQLCQQEGLTVTRVARNGSWCVYSLNPAGPVSTGSTLREAYYRHRAVYRHRAMRGDAE